MFFSKSSSRVSFHQAKLHTFLGFFVSELREGVDDDTEDHVKENNLHEDVEQVIEDDLPRE